MGEPILRLSDISLSFKGIKALSNLSFDVKAGEICALIGPNGAGKSSLLNVICGVYRADDGEISFAGQTLSGAKPFGLGEVVKTSYLVWQMTGHHVRIGRTGELWLGDRSGV